MSLYKDWTNSVIEFVKEKGEQAFWKVYGKIEKSIYVSLLGNHKEVVCGTVSELAKKYGTSAAVFTGFLDGISESLKNTIDVENITEDTEVELDIDFEKLYFNMIDAKADYLYNLPQWEGIFSDEKRNKIHDDWKKSKTIVNKNKVGRNDPCPCGSGKKYKKCCGRNK